MWNVRSKFPVPVGRDPSQESLKRTFPTQQLSQIVDEWLLSQDLADNSRLAYRRNIGGYIRWLEKTERQLNAVTRKDALEFKRYVMDSFAGHTAANYFSAMSRFHLWLESQGVYHNIAKEIRSIKARKGFRKDSLTLEQISQLFCSIERKTLEGKRDYCLIRLLMGTGIRSCELVTADVADARQTPTSETALYIRGKARHEKDSFVIVVPGILAAIKSR